MFRAVLFVVCLFFMFIFIAVPAPILAVHFIFCTIMAVKRHPKFGDYGLDVFIGWDQLANAMFAPLWKRIFDDPPFRFGHPDETISSVIGKNVTHEPAKSHKALFIVNKWLSKADPHSDNHGRDSIEADEGDQVE